MSEELTCITCPMGCRLAVERLAGGAPEGVPGGEISVSGNRCPRGAAYAREELLAPKRTVSATVRARRRPGAVGETSVRRVPCKTSAPFPKEKVGLLLAEIYAAEAELPVARGDVLIRNALGSGIDVVATRTLRSGV